MGDFSQNRNQLSLVLHINICFVSMKRIYDCNILPLLSGLNTTFLGPIAINKSQRNSIHQGKPSSRSASTTHTLKKCCSPECPKGLFWLCYKGNALILTEPASLLKTPMLWTCRPQGRKKKKKKRGFEKGTKHEEVLLTSYTIVPGLESSCQ